MSETERKPPVRTLSRRQTLRSNLSDSVCGSSSSGPGGAMGGPPPRG